MPKDSLLRILVAGAGAFGREQIARLAARADVKLVGVADANADALAQVRARHGVKTCRADALALIDEVAADAIVVATPAVSHVEIATRALGGNLGVLLEKPIAPSATAAAALVAAAERSLGFALPGYVLRFSKDHMRLVDIVRSGRVGDVLYVSSRRYRDDDHAIRYPDEDPVLMTLIHDIDLAQWVAGSDFASVLAHRSKAPGIRSLTAARATTVAGVICDLRTAWTFPAGDLPPDRLEVVGDRGSVELIVGEGARLYSDGRREDYPALADDDPLRNEHDHFLARVADRSLPPALGLAEALAGLRLADAAMESLRSGREVAIAP